MNNKYEDLATSLQVLLYVTLESYRTLPEEITTSRICKGFKGAVLDFFDSSMTLENYLFAKGCGDSNTTIEDILEQVNKEDEDESRYK